MTTKFLVVALASTVLTWSAAAQTSASSQTSVSGSSQSSISAGGGRAHLDSNTSAKTSQDLGVAQKDHDKEVSKTVQGSASAAGSVSNAASANAGSNSAGLASGSTINAVLTKSVDARHAKPGDEVTAKVTQDVKSNGQVVIGKGSKLVGHITEAETREKGEANGQSSLGILFDHAVLKNGDQVATPVVIQALAAVQSNAAATTAMTPTMGPAMSGGGAHSGGGLLGGVGSTVGAAGGVAGNAAGDLGRTAGGVVNATANTTANVAGSTVGNVGGALNASGQLTSQSTGVIGLSGLQLASTASSAAQGSVITSAGKTVKLDSGTQMLLRVTGESAASK